MKNIGIQTPCTEDWNGMTPSEKGAFCQKCTKHVHDFSTKSVHEIKSALLELNGQSVCVRMTTSQEEELNAEFKLWISHKKRNPHQLVIAALLIVFGLALFSCEDERDQRRLESIQQIAYTIASEQVEKMETAPVTDSVVALPPPQEIVVEEIYTMGAYEMPYVQAPPPDPEVKEIIEEHILGGIGDVYAYQDFLQETTPDVELDENGVPYPTEFKALAFPNPAMESTTLEIQAPEKERMDIRLYDSGGKFIREIHSGKISRGTFRELIDLNDLNSGLYLIIIQSKEFKETVRVIKN